MLGAPLYRQLGVSFLLLLMSLAIAGSANAQNIILIPLDNRPAATQFAQMIGAIGGASVTLPPSGDLGRFTIPGNPDRILDWLEQQNLDQTTALVVSTDMVAYGGLIASRTSLSTYDQAYKRLRRLVQIARNHRSMKVYAFSAIMRLAPTATKATAGWRTQLARYVELQERYRQTKSADTLASMRNLAAKIPPIELQRYQDARDRNYRIQRQLISFCQEGIFDYLLFGQDDAQPFGPHIPETIALKNATAGMQVGHKVYFGEGIDQHANLLVSRAMLQTTGFSPRIRVVYADENAKTMFADYESKPIPQGVRDQILAGGAQPMGGDGIYDYTLYLNTPDRRPSQFQQFVSRLTSDIDLGVPVCVADINLGKSGTADSELFAVLSKNDRFFHLLAYAGWNTAGNTIGTSVPAANMYLLARRRPEVDALTREVARREFLLHRMVDDFAYHRFVRPAAYAKIDAMPTASREETYGAAFTEVESLVRKELRKFLDLYFRDNFLGKEFFVGTSAYTIDSLSDITIDLPWPRAYEVRLGFRMVAKARAAPIDPPPRSGGSITGGNTAGGSTTGGG